MLEIIKSFFSPVGGRTSFASQNGNQSRKEGWLLFSNVNSSKNGGGRHLISAISCGGVILCK